MKPLRRQAHNILKWQLLPALMVLLGVQAAWATDPIYDNTGVSQYLIPGAVPPPIDALTFQNEASAEFEVGFRVYTHAPELYETMNTLNYTNLGLMVANSPTTTNGSIYAFLFGSIIGSGSYGSGFNFDRQTTNQISRSMAGTFYNSGDIRCDSIVDGNNTYAPIIENGIIFLPDYFEVTSLGQFSAWATNIISPGSVDIGTGGRLQMSGQNVDLSGGLLNIEPLLNVTFFESFFFNPLFNPNNSEGFTGVGATGGSLFVPAADLTPNLAVATYPPNFPPFTYPFILTNATVYIKDDADPFIPNTVVHRSVFLVNYSPDAAVTANVYFDPIDGYSQFGLFYPGCVNIGWSANTVDPATGNPVSNYLYLTDDYLWGASTNVAVFGNGLPDNFLFDSSSTPLLFGPASPGFVNEFPFQVVTNLYSYMNGTLVSGSVSTNSTGLNPSGSITNLPSRVQITASNTLDLAFTTISGANYLSLNCTNQFQGSPGAAISAAYSDIALGVTNGFLTLSNVLMANLPKYSGPIQSWTTRFQTVDTVAGITNDYRVLLVYSSFEPSSEPWSQNLYLHGTNSLVISDHYNVYNSLYSDATSLTLKTNQVGVGATSLDGELRWYNPATFNANSGSGLQQFPNLLWITNSGAFRAYNNANFGNPAAPAFVVTPGVSPATNYTTFINHSLVADQGTAIWTSYFESDGTLTNGTGTFQLHSGSAVLTNGSIYAGGDVILTATNSPGLGFNELQISNQFIQAGHQLTLACTNLTGDSVTNGNVFVVGTTSVGGAADSGFNTLLKGTGDLLGTTVTNIAPFNKTIYNVWAGNDFGISPLGFSNNLAVGHLVLDSVTTNTANPPVAFRFQGLPGATNALYVDLLELRDGATKGNPTNNYNFPWLLINSNMTIYYGRAIRNVNGQIFDDSEAIDYASQFGANGGVGTNSAGFPNPGRLRWVYSYAGHLSSTNLVYTNTAGVVITNTVNLALAQSPVIDSDSDGIPNAIDPTPFLLPSALHFTASATNLPPQAVMVQWATIPNATNFIYYTTNFLATNLPAIDVPATNGWLPFTNFQSWYFGNQVAVTNLAKVNSFRSPQVYINNPNLPDNSQQTNVWIYDIVTNVPHYYKVMVWPNLLVNHTNAP